MKSLILCVTLGVFVSAGAVPAQAQGVLTVGALLAAANSLINSLNDVVTNAGVTASSTIGQATSQVSLLETQLNQDVNGDVTVPLQNLNVTAQNTANTLQALVQQLNSLLDKQRNCLDLDLNLFLAGVQTSVEQAKQGIPLISTQGARLNQFVFAGHSPNVVPPDGGVMTVSGLKLWQNEPPKLSLTSSAAGDQEVVDLEPGRQSDNDIVATVSGDTIKANAGKCLFVRVQPMQSSGWWIFKKVVADDPLVLPFCLPDNSQTLYALSATNSYQCPSVSTFTQTSDYQTKGNSNCGGQAGASANYPFVAPANENCRIVGASPVRGNNTTRELGSTSASFAAMTVTLNGQLDTARCANVGPIQHKFSDAVWQYAASATIQCDLNSPGGANKTSDWVKADYPQTNLCVDLPKSCLPQQSDIQVTVSRSLGSLQRVIYDKSGTATAATLDLGVASLGATTSDANYTEGVSAVPARACANVTVVACGY